MPTELKGMRVNFLSLVHKGANGKKIIWKSAGQSGADKEAIEITLKKICKSDEKRMVYGIVYSPEQVDSQGEFAKAAEIETAAYEFMKDLRLHHVDSNHDFDPKAAFVAESWLTKGADNMFPGEPEGSWAVGIRVEDDTLWNDIKKGNLAGISMAGVAVKVKKEDEGLLKKSEEILMKLLKMAAMKTEPAKDVQPDQASQEELETLTKILKAAESNSALEKQVIALSARVETLEKSTFGQMSKGIGDHVRNDGICLV